jgi:hypothetical protein
MRPVVGVFGCLMYDGALISPGHDPIACTSRSIFVNHGKRTNGPHDTRSVRE